MKKDRINYHAAASVAYYCNTTTRLFLRKTVQLLSLALIFLNASV